MLSLFVFYFYRKSLIPFVNVLWRFSLFLFFLYYLADEFLDQFIYKKYIAIYKNNVPKKVLRLIYFITINFLWISWKLGLRNISKRITSCIFLNIYTPPQHALTRIILFLLRWLVKLNLNLTQKLKKPYILTWKSLKLI